MEQTMIDQSNWCKVAEVELVNILVISSITSFTMLTGMVFCYQFIK